VKSTKKEKRSKKERKLREGRPVEDAAPVEIDKDAFGMFLPMISTSCLESTKRFPHLPTGPAAVTSNL
jgi:hypothetical protein